MKWSLVDQINTKPCHQDNQAEEEEAVVEDHHSKALPVVAVVAAAEELDNAEITIHKIIIEE